MPYLLAEVELDEPTPTFRLGAQDTGIGIVSRRDGHVVGFAMHGLDAGATLQPEDVNAILDPIPTDPPVIHPSRRDVPTFTVAICTRDRPELLRECLVGLRAIDEALPILVVDNAPSDDRTQAVAKTYGARYAIEPCPGLDFARNCALKEATGEVVAFVDDDVVVDHFWFESLQSVWSRHPDAGMVTGQILPVELETEAQIAFEQRGGFRGGNEQTRYQGMDLVGNDIYPYGPGMFGAGANMSIKRDVALRLGGFDEVLDTGPPLPGGGDIDMMHRVIRAGLALVYEPRVVVFHRHRRDWAGLRRQYDSWGRSLMAFATKTYRADPAGRRKLRRLVRWFFVHQARELRTGVDPGDVGACRAALAELRGGAMGLLGTYGRSRRRSQRRRRDHGRPTVAILPWGDVVEDYITPLGLSVDDYVERLSGGWLFGFAEGLARAGVDTVIVCWSRSVRRPTRRVHLPTGSVLWLLPSSRVYRLARSQLTDVYAWSLAEALGDASGRPALVRGAVARAAAPFLTSTPRVLARVLRREACRAVLLQEYEEGRFDVCIGVGRVMRLPVYATFQGGDHTRTRIERWTRGRAVRAAAGLIVAAKPEADRVVEEYGVPSKRIARIANPLDPATVIRRPRDAAREELGIAEGTRVAVWVGRVDVVPKGMDVLVEAWSDIRTSSAGKVKLLLLGTGPGSEWLHGQFDDLDFDDVQWRDEYVLDRKVIGTYLSAADVFVLPSRQEGFPVAPVEAMAAGLPVVATDAPGVRAVVGEGEVAGGIVVPRGDARSLAVEVRRLLDDPTLCSTIGARAAERVRVEFSLEAIGEKLRAFLVEKPA